MREIFFRDTEWNTIKFSELGVKLTPNRTAGSAFYQAFYAKFKEKFKSYADLPANWLETKRQTATELSKILSPEESVLSYGAGPGYVEHLLQVEYGFNGLLLTDYSPAFQEINPSAKFKYVPLTSLFDEMKEEQLDAIILVQVLYAMPRRDAINLLRALRALVKEGGRIILADTSERGLENTGIQNTRMTFLDSYFLAKALSLPRAIKHSIRSNGIQGWGWKRDNAMIANILETAGWKVDSQLPRANQSFTVGVKTERQ